MRIALRLLTFLFTFIAVSVCAHAVATNISTCYFNISFPGEYTLNQTINSTQESCINITTSNVSLDCKGFWMNGSVNNTGIFVNASNITISNCNITGFKKSIGVYNSANITVINATLEGNNLAFGGSSYGVYFSGVSYGTVLNSTARNYSMSGIYFNTTSRSNITNCTSYSNMEFFSSYDSGITLEVSSNNTLANNTVYRNHIGIYFLARSHENTIIDNKLDYNGYYGIAIQYSNNNKIINNTASNQTRDPSTYLNYGIYVANSNYTNLTANTARNNDYGMYISTYATGSVIRNNILAYNNRTTSSLGLYIYLSNSSNVTNNTIFNNTYGLILSSSSNNLVINNTVNNNTFTGITLQSSSDYNSLIDNTVANHSIRGIYLSSSDNNNISSNILANNTLGLYIDSSDDNWFQDNVINSKNMSVTFIGASANHFYNNTLLGSLPTTLSFDTYSGDLNISELSSYPSAQPKPNIGKFLNISGTDSVRITINYSDSDIANANILESALGIYHYVSGAWSLVSSTLSASDNLISATLSSFSEVGVLASSSSLVLDGMNVTLAKAGSSDPVTSGTSLTYTISITTAGLSPFTNITNLTLTDTYPAGVVFVSAQPTALAGTNNTFIIGNITTNTTIQVNITVTVPAALEGVVINNTANVSFVNDTSIRYNLTVTENTTVSTTVTPSGGGSGGGGGGGVSYGHTYTMTTTTQAYSLKRMDKVLFNVDALQHALTILRIGTTTVLVQVYSQPQRFELAKGVAQEVDLTGDGKMDLRLTLTGISYYDANILIELLGMPCVENWVCESWSECTAGTQARECTDVKACGTTSLKPKTSQECTATASPLPKAAEPPAPAAGYEPATEPVLVVEPEAKMPALDKAFYALAIAALVALGIYLYWMRKKK